MRKKMLRKTAIITMICMAISMIAFTGCSVLGPSDAQGVLEKYKANQEDFENCHMEGDMEFGIAISTDDKELQSALGGSGNINMPMEIRYDMDTGKESAHGDMKISASMFGENMSENAEVYIDIEDGYVYSKNEQGEWIKSKSDTDTFMQYSDLSDIDKETAESFDFEKTDDGYILTTDMKKLEDAHIFDSVNEYLAQFDIHELDISDKGTIVYEFDKDCNLTKMEIKDVELKSTISDEAAGTFTYTIGMDAEIELSKYNELEKSDYEIPKKIIKGAKDGEAQGDEFTTQPQITQPDATQPDVTQTEQPQDTQSVPTTNNNTGGTVLHGDDVSGNDKLCFVVGQDIASGTYTAYFTGQGVMNITDAEDYGQNYHFSYGYGIDTDTPDKQTVELDNGDQIFMTEDLIVTMR